MRFFQMLVAVVLMVLGIRPLKADGVHFSAQEMDARKHLMEPAQKVVISWEGGTETMVLSSAVKEDSIQDVAWVIPLPSKRPPVVTAVAEFKAFNTLTWLFASDELKTAADRDGITKMARAAGMAQVEIVSDQVIDVYDVTVIKAVRPAAVTDWLRGHGYKVDSVSAKGLAALSDGPMYYVVNRIDLQTKHREAYALVKERVQSLWDEYISLCAAVDAQSQAMKLPERLLPAALQGLEWDPQTAAQVRINGPDNPADLPVLRSWTMRGGYEVVERYAAPAYYGPPHLEAKERVWILLKNGVPRQTLNYVDGRFVQEKRLFADSFASQYFGAKDALSSEAVQELKRLILGQFADGKGGSDDLYKESSQKIQGFAGQNIAGLNQLLQLKRLAAAIFPRKGEAIKPGDQLSEQQLTSLAGFEIWGSPLQKAISEIEEELRRLGQGVATPLKIVFQPAEPMFPLKISGLGKGQTWIEVYVLGVGIARDRNGSLAYDAARPLDEETRRNLQELPPQPEGMLVTRLTYKGLLENLKADAVFAPMSKDPVRR